MAEREREEFGGSIDWHRPRAFVLEGSREEFEAWQRAALSEGKIFDEWIRDGLNRLARERGYATDPASLQALPLVAEKQTGYRATRSADGSSRGRPTPPSEE